MLLSELLGSTVQNKDGRHIGYVVDVRFQRQPAGRGHEGALTLIALIVSPHSRMSFYGYERGRVDQPVAIAKPIGWLHRRSRVIPWECVQRVETDAVILGVDPPDIPLDVRRAIPGQR
nr:PRC-barrel domain containing protein [Microbacterium bovistercoris]